MVYTKGGILVIDDSTLDKHHASKIELATCHWSGKHRRVAWCFNLMTAVWTDGDRIISVDHRVDESANHLTKNDHFSAMLGASKARGFELMCMAFDRWYSGPANLKALRGHGRTFLTQLTSIRKVDLDRQGDRSVSKVAIAVGGTVVHLQGFGSIRVIFRDGDTGYLATNDLAMEGLTRLAVAERA